MKINSPERELKLAIKSLENHCERVLTCMAKPKRDVRSTWYLFFLWWPAEQYIRACIRYVNSIRKGDLAMYRNLLRESNLRVRDMDYETWTIKLEGSEEYVNKLRIKVFFSLIGAEFIWKPSMMEEGDLFRISTTSGRTVAWKVLDHRRKDWELSGKEAILKALDWDESN